MIKINSSHPNHFANQFRIAILRAVLITRTPTACVRRLLRVVFRGVDRYAGTVSTSWKTRPPQPSVRKIFDVVRTYNTSVTITTRRLFSRTTVTHIRLLSMFINI